MRASGRVERCVLVSTLRGGLARAITWGLASVGTNRESLFYGRRPQEHDYSLVPARGEAGNVVVRDLLREGRPCLVTRLGNTELHVANFWARIRSRCPLPTAFKPGYRHGVAEHLQANAGFFPLDARNLDRFSKLYLASLSHADVLAVWALIDEHMLIRRRCPNALLVDGTSLDSMVYESPWSAELEGKRVLVIHPFAASIEKQYREHRAQLFKNPKVLPEFELTTIRSVQSIAGNKTEFATWFDAYDHMCGQIDRASYDIAIIGAGAYGLPLGAFVKSRGKQAVHLGGVTQLLFGIMGRRWETEYDDQYRSLVKDAWVRASAEETPAGHDTVESSAYW